MKKGSFDFGISMTFIITVAVIILGIALVFVLKVFEFADEKVPATAPEIIFHANADNIIYPEGRDIKIKPGMSDTYLVSVYNDKMWAEDELIGLAFGECSNDLNSVEPGITLSSVSQSILRERDKGYAPVIKVGKDVAPGRYSCNLFAGVVVDGFIDETYPSQSRQVPIIVS